MVLVGTVCSIVCSFQNWGWLVESRQFVCWRGLMPAKLWISTCQNKGPQQKRLASLSCAAILQKWLNSWGFCRRPLRVWISDCRLSPRSSVQCVDSCWPLEMSCWVTGLEKECWLGANLEVLCIVVFDSRPFDAVHKLIEMFDYNSFGRQQACLDIMNYILHNVP